MVKWTSNAGTASQLAATTALRAVIVVVKTRTSFWKVGVTSGFAHSPWVHQVMHLDHSVFGYMRPFHERLAPELTIDSGRGVGRLDGPGELAGLRPVLGERKLPLRDVRR